MTRFHHSWLTAVLSNARFHALLIGRGWGVFGGRFREGQHEIKIQKEVRVCLQSGRWRFFFWVTLNHDSEGFHGPRLNRARPSLYPAATGRVGNIFVAEGSSERRVQTPEI